MKLNAVVQNGVFQDVIFFLMDDWESKDRKVFLYIVQIVKKKLDGRFLKWKPGRMFWNSLF